MNMHACLLCYAMRRPSSLLTERVQFGFGRMGLWKVIMAGMAWQVYASMVAVRANESSAHPTRRDATSKTCAISSFSRVSLRTLIRTKPHYIALLREDPEIPIRLEEV